MNRHGVFILIAWASSVLLPALGAGGAWALEGAAPTGPIGGTDVRSALLPPPGLYGVAVGADVAMGDLYTPIGAIPASGSTLVGGGALLYVYDTSFLGGSIASSIYAGYEQQCYGVRQPGARTCVDGIIDIYSDLLLWSFFIPDKHSSGQQGGIFPIPYGLAIQFGVGVGFPTGPWNLGSPLNVGANFYDIVPNIAFTYTIPSIFGLGAGDATEFSTRIFHHFYTKNHDTNYKTGNILNIDWAITQRLDNWQFGLSGTYWSQVSNDEINGLMVGPDGNQAMGIAMGPVLSYDFIAAERPWNLTFKWNIRIKVENTPAAELFLMRLGTKMF